MQLQPGAWVISPHLAGLDRHGWKEEARVSDLIRLMQKKEKRMMKRVCGGFDLFLS